MPKTVVSAEEKSSPPTVCPQGTWMPLQRMAKAVREQITTVSAKTSKMPQSPCSGADLTSAEAWAMAAEPSPASLEKALRRRPHCRACPMAAPLIPPPRAFREKALRIISRSTPGSLWAWQRITPPAAMKNTPLISGTSTAVALPVPTVPRKMAMQVMRASVSPRTCRNSPSLPELRPKNAAARVTAPAALLIWDMLPMPKAARAASRA